VVEQEEERFERSEAHAPRFHVAVRPTRRANALGKGSL
jgi:hypothetical protein